MTDEAPSRAVSTWPSVFKHRALRSCAYHAMGAWQYLVGSNVELYELGISTWRRVVSRVPVREHLLVCDPRATSPVSLPPDTRALVTSVRDAKLDHFEDILKAARLLAEAPDVERVFDTMTRDGERYRFRLLLNPRDVTDPRNAVFAKFALQPKIVGLVTRHLRMPCQLNEIKLLIDRPTSDPPRASQLWHRDPDDWTTVSVFVYLSDVGPESAPFCYIPWEQSRKVYGKSGRFRELASWRVTPDAVMERAIPREHWEEVTGEAGTVVFIDSASCFHRGKAAESQRRLCLQLIFTSTLTRMDLLEENSSRLLRPEFERRYTFESPRYSVASSARAVT